jgi:hypothetical protein
MNNRVQGQTGYRTHLKNSNNTTENHLTQSSFHLDAVDSTLESFSTTLQPTLGPAKDNLPFGDLITTQKQKATLRIFFQNVNGIFKFKSWETLKEASKSLLNL